MYLEKYTNTVQQPLYMGRTGSEQAIRVTVWRREMRWEMIELKNCQQYKTEGQTAISLTPEVDGTGSGSFLKSEAHLQLEGLYVKGSLYIKCLSVQGNFMQL